MGIVLSTPQEVVGYIEKNMLKDEAIEALEDGEISPSKPVIKWLNNDSSWENRIAHSGNLEVCLKGRGIGFQSFIPQVTNRKETIVIYNIPRKLTSWIKYEAGSGYLSNFQRSASSNYVTSTLSVFVAARPWLPEEIQWLIDEYLTMEQGFISNPSKSMVGRLLLRDSLAELEQGLDAVISKKARGQMFRVINKISTTASKGFVSSAVDEMSMIIRKTARNEKVSPNSILTLTKFMDDLSAVTSKVTLFTNPSRLASRAFSTVVDKSMNKAIGKDNTKFIKKTKSKGSRANNISKKIGKK